MSINNLTPNILDSFIGTENYWRWSPLFPFAVLSDGAKYIADNEAAWLIDAICSHQGNPKVRQTRPQFWSLSHVISERAGLSFWRLLLERDEGQPVVEQQIEYSDFPIGNFPRGIFKIWADWTYLSEEGPEVLVIFLPSEY